MLRPDRRRFLTIAAGLAAWTALPARAVDIYRWRGTALGAGAAIYIAHPDAEVLAARAAAEIARLEEVFSLYRSGSALSRLNAAGRLDSPPPELVACLGLSGRIHAATGGLFDPTIQPLWQLYAERCAAGSVPAPAEIAEALGRTGWHGVQYGTEAVVLRPGMALTLNGIAQGFIADRVADMLAAEGLTDILVDTGELRALGGRPGGGDWPVRIEGAGRIGLAGRALATSAAFATVLDGKGRIGHILDPRSGLPAAPLWQSASVSAPLAAVADGLSTAACLMPDRRLIEDGVRQFAGAAIEALVAGQARPES